MKASRIIGIDPDIDRNGVCYLNTSTRKVEVCTMDFPHLLEYLADFQNKADVVVVVEAGWKNAITNYHGGYGRVAENIARQVGRNQQVGHCIVEMLKHWKIPFVEKAPLRKMWQGKDRKITHEELAQFVKDLPSRTNQEGRDACLLAWDYAGFPIRITLSKKVANKQDLNKFLTRL